MSSMSAVSCDNHDRIRFMSIPTAKTYAEIVRGKLQDSKNRKSMREIGRNVGYSYEHVRKVVAGELTFTQEFSDALCAELGLDAPQMWRLAQTEKLRARYEGADFGADVPKDPRLKEIWDALDATGREALIQIGRQLVLVSENREWQRREVRA
jgi:hypothetical protein